MKSLKKALVMTVMLMAFLFGGLLSMNVQAKGKGSYERDDNVPGVDGCSIVLPEPEAETQGNEDPEDDEYETSGDEENTENEDK